MKVGRWSTTAASNNATPPDGWPEGQAPSTVNDCAREMMASIRAMLNDVSFIDLDHSPTQTTSTTFTMPGNVVAFYDVGRRVKAFDASTLYGTVISASFTTNTGVTLRLDSGVLTSSLTSVATSVLSNKNQALPENAMRVENAVINGELDVWQRGGTFAVPSAAVAASTYLADMWAINQVSGATLNITRSERSAAASNVPTIAQCGKLLNNSMCISVSTTDAAIAAGDYCYFSNNILGATWSKIAQKPNTCSFFANSNRTGTYCVSFRNAGSDRTFVQEFQISAVSTWEQKTIQVPESPTAGTWDYSFGSGLEIGFCLAAGTGLQTTNAGQWTATVAIATSNQVNFLASAGNTLRIADLRYHEGTQLLPIRQRPFQEELELCKSIFQKSNAYADGIGSATDVGMVGFNNMSVAAGAYVIRVPFSPPMNTVPAITFYSRNSGNPGFFYDGIGSDYTAGVGASSLGGFAPINAAAAAKTAMFFHWTAHAPLK